MKKIIVSFFFLLLLAEGKATHNRSGEILYERIAPFTDVVGGVTVNIYKYRITLVKYTDDGPAIADRCQDTLDFGDGTKGLAHRTNGATGVCGCGATDGCGVIIVNNPGYKVKKNTYEIIHTYNGPGNYTIRYSDLNRTPGSNNIPNSGSVPFSLNATIRINSVSGINSSPVLTNPPVDQATVGVCFYHDLGAIDPDGDSLSYSPTICLGNGSAPIPGYTYPGYGTSTTYSFGATGTLTWCVPTTIGEYNLAVFIIEWRKNPNGIYQNIGNTLRDMQVLVNPGTPVGINKNDLAENTVIYPNPFNKNLEIDLGANSYNKLQSSVYSVDGKLVFSEENRNVSGKLNLPLNELKPGIYTLTLKTDTGVLYKKIVKD